MIIILTVYVCICVSVGGRFAKGSENIFGANVSVKLSPSCQIGNFAHIIKGHRAKDHSNWRGCFTGVQIEARKSEHLSWATQLETAGLKLKLGLQPPSSGLSPWCHRAFFPSVYCCHTMLVGNQASGLLFLLRLFMFSPLHDHLLGHLRLLGSLKDCRESPLLFSLL